jgi:hypothetical protein
MTYNLDKATKTLTADLTATFFADYNGTLKWNFVIVEDGQTGTGSQWDQSNYLNGNADYKDHPFFSLPSKITGFVHKNVVLDYIGGVDGDDSGMPSSIKNGAVYTKKYTIDLSTMSNIQNIDHLWFVGWLQDAATYKIVNAVSANKKPTRPTVAAKISSANLFVTGLRNSTIKNTLTVANTYKNPIEVTLSVDEANSVLPDGWTYEFSKNTFTIPAFKTVDVEVTTTTSNNPGCANYTFLSVVKPTAEYEVVDSKLEVYNMSDGIKYALLKPSGETATGFQMMKDQITTMMPYSASLGILPYNADTYRSIDLEQFKLVIYPESWQTASTMVMNTFNMGNGLYPYINHGNPALIVSPFNLFYVAKNDPGSTPSWDIENLFTNGLYITGQTQTYDSRWLYDNATKKYVTINIKGKDGEPMTQGMNFKINDSYGESPNQNGWVDLIKILDNNRVKEILTYDNPRIPTATSTAAVKIQYDKVKVIYQGFGFDAMKNWGQTRTLLGNYLAWLTGVTDVEPGEMNPSSLAVYPNPAFNFGEISVTPSKEINNAEITIYDNSGKLIETVYNGYLSPNKSAFKLNCSNYPNGSYHIIANMNGVYSYQQLVISH